MSATAIIFKFALCIFIAAAVYSDGVFAANIALKVQADHERHTRQNSNSSRCYLELVSNFPRNCNLTLLFDPFPDVSSNAEQARLNAAYASSCIPACTDPLAKYYHCIFSSTPAIAERLTNLLQNGICGQENGEYCPVKYARLNISDDTLNSCNSDFSGIICNTTTPTSCLDGLATIVPQLGCCASPYFGTGLSTCRGITADPPCGTSTSPASGVYPFAAISMMVFAIFGLFL